MTRSTATAPTTVATSPSSAVAVSGTLTLTLAASATRIAPGAPITVTVSATDTQARGALAYRVSYGDGTSDQNVVPQFCLAGAGIVSHQTWPLTHRYTASGNYLVVATVTATCTPDRATATLSVISAR